MLELDPNSADALLGLAMIAFGSPNAQEGLNSGLQYLQRAYAADPTHPGVLCVLSHFSLVKGQYEQVGGHSTQQQTTSAQESYLRTPQPSLCYSLMLSFDCGRCRACILHFTMLAVLSVCADCLC